MGFDASTFCASALSSSGRFKDISIVGRLMDMSVQSGRLEASKVGSSLTMVPVLTLPALVESS